MPLRAALPVSKALRNTHSYLRLRHNRSMKTLSIQRPRPSMEMRMPASLSVAVKAKRVNCAPLSVLKMSGLPWRECQDFCVWLIRSMLLERSKDDDNF